MSRASKAGRAFTLIEVLIVVSIIGLLASIILVALQGARDKSISAAGYQQSMALYQVYGSDAVGVWNFDEGSGTVTANSITGRNDSITGAGVTWVTGAVRNALHFDGSGGYVDIPDTPLLSTFTLAAWVYDEPGGDARHSIIQDFWEIVNDNQICFWSYSFSATYWRCSDPGAVAPNKWIFLATSWDGSVIRHYVNGKIVWTDSTPASGTSQSFYSIGQGCCGGRQFKGSIDEIRIYSRALGTAEIDKLYAQSVDRHPPVAAKP